MGLECDFVAHGETAEDAIKAGMEHAMADHSDVLESMKASSTEEEMNAKAMSMVKDA